MAINKLAPGTVGGNLKVMAVNHTDQEGYMDQTCGIKVWVEGMLTS